MMVFLRPAWRFQSTPARERATTTLDDNADDQFQSTPARERATNELHSVEGMG